MDQPALKISLCAMIVSLLTLSVSVPAHSRERSCANLFATQLNSHYRSQKLQELGYIQTVAQRIATEDPDLADKILHSSNRDIVDFRVPDDYQRKARQPILSEDFKLPKYRAGYRGLSIKPEDYNPESGSELHGDSTWFGDLGQSSIYASDYGVKDPNLETGIILEIQIPDMLTDQRVKIRRSHRYVSATTYSKYQIRDESLFITRIGIVNGAIGEDSYEQGFVQIVKWYEADEFFRIFQTPRR